MPGNDHFDGKGFSSEPFAPEEISKIRHLFREVSEEWVSMGSVATVIKAASIFSQAIKVGTPIMLFFAALGMFLKTQGFLQ